jgi:predicted esterase
MASNVYLLSRRRVAHALLGATLLARMADAARAFAGDDELEARDLDVEGAGARHRMRLFLPRRPTSPPNVRVPLLVLLHGLGETTDEQLGAHAWSDRYGLVTAYERLRHPPVARTSTRADWTDARLAEVNASLAARPFRGFVVACPFMPQPRGSIDAYARWLIDAAIPRARLEAGALLGDPRETMLGGCSLGGYASLEIFLRHADLFRAWGGVQTAISEASAASYAARIADVTAKNGGRDILLETSTLDPFRKANVALAAALEARGVARELRVLPGPHDQPWLREAGTIEALLWFDRR